MSVFFATTGINAATLQPRMAKLLAFMQAHMDYKSGYFFWSKRRTCEALGISASTYARALRELQKAGFIDVKARFHENGMQRTNLVIVKRFGYRFPCETEAVHELSSGALKVFFQASSDCGRQNSFAISRRSFSEKCRLSLRSITRIVRSLKERFFLRVRSETRAHIFGNNGQTFNRFSVIDEDLRAKLRLRYRLILFALLANAFFPSPLDKIGTPNNEVPMLITGKEKTKSSIIARLKEKISRWISRALKRKRLIRKLTRFKPENRHFTHLQGGSLPKNKNLPPSLIP